MAKGDVTMTFDAQTANFIQKVRAAASEMEAAGKGAEELGSKANKAGKKMKDSFGDEMFRDLTQLATGYLTVTTAVNTLTDALARQNAERKKGLEVAQQAEVGMAQLVQLAGGDQKKLNDLIAQAKQTYAEGGASSLDQAARTVFQLNSGGFAGDRELFSRLYPTVQNPADMIRSMAALRTSFGEGETGGTKDILSKVFAAADKTTTDPTKLLEAAARSGGSGSMLGLSDEEAIAMTAVSAKAAGSPERGGTRVDAFFNALNRKGGFKGLGAKGIFEKLRSMNMTDQQLIKFLGSEEAQKGYSDVEKNFSEVEMITQAQNKAQSEGLIDTILESAEQNELLGAQRDLRKSQAQDDLAKMTAFGVEEAKKEAAINRASQKSVEKGEGGFRRGLRQAGLEFASHLGATPEQLEGASDMPLPFSGDGSVLYSTFENFSNAVDSFKTNVELMKEDLGYGKSELRSRHADANEGKAE